MTMTSRKSLKVITGKFPAPPRLCWRAHARAQERRPKVHAAALQRQAQLQPAAPVAGQEVLVHMASRGHLLRRVRALILLPCSRVLAVAAQASTRLNTRCRTCS